MANIDQLVNLGSSMRITPAEKEPVTTGTEDSKDSFGKLMADKAGASEVEKKEVKNTTKEEPKKTEGKDDAEDKEVPEQAAALVHALVAETVLELPGENLEGMANVDVTRAAIEPSIVMMKTELPAVEVNAAQPQAAQVQVSQQPAQQIEVPGQQVPQQPTVQMEQQMPMPHQTVQQPEHQAVQVTAASVQQEAAILKAPAENLQKADRSSSVADGQKFVAPEVVTAQVTGKETAPEKDMNAEYSYEDSSKQQDSDKGKSVDSQLAYQDTSELRNMQRTDQTRSVRIKVAAPYQQIDQSAVKQMADNIGKGISEGAKELQIQLTPEHLGKISISISVMEAGTKVLLSCENQKTLSLLTDRLVNIERIVESNTNLPTVVEVKEDGYWNQQKNSTDQHTNQNFNQQEQQDNKEDTADADGFVQQLRLGLYGDKLAM